MQSLSLTSRAHSDAAVVAARRQRGERAWSRASGCYRASILLKVLVEAVDGLLIVTVGVREAN